MDRKRGGRQIRGTLAFQQAERLEERGESGIIGSRKQDLKRKEMLKNWLRKIELQHNMF